MILIGTLFILLGFGFSALAAAWLSKEVGAFRGILFSGGSFLTILALLWCTSLLLVAPLSWLFAALAAMLLAFAGTRERPLSLSSLLFPSEFAVLVFHFTLDLFDMAMSTRRFSSDWALLLTAVERSIEAGRLKALLLLLAVIALGVFSGRLLGRRIRPV